MYSEHGRYETTNSHEINTVNNVVHTIWNAPPYEDTKIQSHTTERITNMCTKYIPKLQLEKLTTARVRILSSEQLGKATFRTSRKIPKHIITTIKDR